MQYQRSNHIKPNRRYLVPMRVVVAFNIIIVSLFSVQTQLKAQDRKFERDPYILREDDKLEIVVHIWGEVRNPGEYSVQDGTNALELISIAGGPTDHSNLRKVMITRSATGSRQGSPPSPQLLGNQAVNNYQRPQRSQVSNLDIQGYLNGNQSFLPALRPGDVVMIKKNSKHKWSAALKVVTQAAIVLQAAYWYSRIN